MLDQCLIIVCQGDEYKAVKKGLGDRLGSQLISIPIGIKGVKNRFNDTNSNYDSAKKVLVIGLGGSISPEFKVGDVVIFNSCSYQRSDGIVTKQCDRDLNNELQSKLKTKLINGLTTDKIVINSSDKTQLFERTNCSVVDMESYGVITRFDSVSIIRVISDNYNDDLPDLNGAITPDGKLDMLKMSIVFLQQPVKAIKLIQNALISLKKLEEVARKISSN